MSKQDADAIEVEGTILESLPNAMFKVKLSMIMNLGTHFR